MAEKFIRRASKWGQPLKSIIMDYLEVSKDIMTDFKSKPVKSVFFVSVCGTVAAFIKKCPDHNSYKNEVIEYSNELGLCAEVNRNHQTTLYIDGISSIISNSCIQHLNLGVCSLIVLRPCSYKCQNYHEVCKYLQPRKWMLYHSILDVGIWDQWLVLTRKMVDFDVNDSEFTIKV